MSGVGFLMAGWLLGTAHAGEVVWINTPAPEWVGPIATAVGAEGEPLSAMDFRSAAFRWSEADEESYNVLKQTLDRVREYETQLDGELIIMADLADPIAAIGVIQNEGHRSELYAALTYQGFAVDRFFGDALATDERAEPYRIDLNGQIVERPWVDAAALDPQRKVTPYEIAEAVQRNAYGEAQIQARSALPARLVVGDLPEGTRLIVDGRPVSEPVVTLVPGRHLIHIADGDRVYERFDIQLQAGQRQEVAVTLTDDDWLNWVKTVRAGAPQPRNHAKLAPHISALGGEVWIAELPPGAKRPLVWKATPDGVESVSLDMKSGGASVNGLSIGAGIGGGWFYDGNFYLQDPSQEPTTGLVNAGMLRANAEIDFDIGLARFGAGVNLAITLGPNHSALYGETHATRVRATPQLVGGIRYAQLTFGFQFPYHIALGGQATIPVFKGIEVLAGGQWGIPSPMKRIDEAEWNGSSTVSLWLGIGYRLRPGGG